MVFSILLLLITLLIILDSIGSKRLRSQVIRLAKTYFVEAKAPTALTGEQWRNLPPLLQQYMMYACAKKAPPGNLRMRYKAATQKRGRKGWLPLEAKLFLTARPRRMLYYEDRTLGFLVSQKRFRQVDKAKVEQSQRILSLFPQPVGPELLVQMHQMALLAWQPGHSCWTDLDWQSVDKCLLVAQLPAVSMSITLEIDPEHGQLKALQCTAEAAAIELSYRYHTYETIGEYQVPMAFVIEEKYDDARYLYRCQVVDLIYEEDFAWW